MMRRPVSVASAVLMGAALLGACTDDGSSGSSAKRTTTSRSPSTAATTSVATTTTTLPVRPGDSPVQLVRSIVPADGFKALSSIVVDSRHGRVYVVDSDNRRIVSFALDGSDPGVIEADGAPLFFRSEGSLGAVDLDGDGSLWVAESGAQRILHLTPEGEVLDDIGSDTAWKRLFSVAVDPINGLVYGIDDELDQIVVFDRAGHELQRIAGPGSEPGLLHDVGNIELLADGSFWVADAGNHRLQHLDRDGSVLRTIGPFATGEPGFIEYPNDVALDTRGRLWVADYEGGAVVAFAPDGTPVARFGGEGDAYHPKLPVSLAFDAEGLLYVAERDHEVVYVYKVLLD